MKWEKKDNDGKLGFCIPDYVKEYFEEDSIVHIPDPLKGIVNEVTVNRLKEPIAAEFKNIVMPDPEIITKIKDEIDSRGCFSVDVPKLVDVLFKLGIIVPREDFK